MSETARDGVKRFDQALAVVQDIPGQPYNHRYRSPSGDTIANNIGPIFKAEFDEDKHMISVTPHQTGYISGDSGVAWLIVLDAPNDAAAQAWLEAAADGNGGQSETFWCDREARAGIPGGRLNIPTPLGCRRVDMAVYYSTANGTSDSDSSIILEAS